MQKIKKIVIPVAGYGTRFLPFTKSIPKEMLPIVDRPVIQHIVEEAVGAGIEEVILVTGYSKRAIEDYFDYNGELEAVLEKAGKHAQKQLTRDVSDIAKFVYVRQKEQLGTGHAVLQAKELIGDEPFMVVSGDDVYEPATPSRLQLLVEAYQKHHAPVLFTLERSLPEDYDRYGYVRPGADLGGGIFEVQDVIEKPGISNAPSTKASFIANVLTPDIFPILESLEPGKGGEIWLTDAINRLAHQRQVIAVSGGDLKYYDCGNKLEYLKAVVDFALKRDDVGPHFRDYLRSLSL